VFTKDDYEMISSALAPNEGGVPSTMQGVTSQDIEQHRDVNIEQLEAELRAERNPAFEKVFGTEQVSDD
jgi:hypothetical protein